MLKAMITILPFYRLQFASSFLYTIPPITPEEYNKCSPYMQSVLQLTFTPPPNNPTQTPTNHTTQFIPPNHPPSNEMKPKASSQQSVQDPHHSLKDNDHSLKDQNHSLKYFRHMLAGPLVNQVALDKFCSKKGCDLVLDVKYDGERTLISYDKKQKCVRMMSRNGKFQDGVYKKIYREVLESLQKTQIESIKIDGQIMALNRADLTPLPYSQLLKYRRVREEDLLDLQKEDQTKLFLIYVFDVLQQNGVDLLQTPLLERRKLIPPIPIFKPVEYQLVKYPQERPKIFQFFSEVLDRKYEGLIIKGTSDKYYTNESRAHWKKLKRGFVNNRDSRISRLELDLILMGANRGRSFNNSTHFTSYLMGARHNGAIIPISAVGSGFSEESTSGIRALIERDGLLVEKVPEEYNLSNVRADVYFRPQIIFEIQAQQLSISPLYQLGKGKYGGLSLRFPTFKRVREDKGLRQSTTGEEIMQMSRTFNFNLPQ